MRKLGQKAAASRILMVFAALLLVGLYSLRLIHLDQDLPPWGVGYYQPKDEGCYAIMAINEWEYGAINPSDTAQTGADFPIYIQEHVRINFLGNLLEMISFHLLGDNYYGLRAPMVLIGCLNLLLTGGILLLLRRRYRRKSSAELWGILGILLVTAFQFYYYLSSRTVEPTTLRMLFTQLVLLIWLLLEKRRGLCFFLMGAVITVSVFLVYITNVFLYLAAGLLILALWYKEGLKSFLKAAVWFTAGALLFFMIAEAYYRMVWNTSALSNMLGAINAFSSSSGYEIAGGGIFSTLRGLLKGAFKYFSAYWFLYAPALLGLFMILLPLMLWHLVRKKDTALFLMLAVPFAFLLQTMVVEDYVWRKLLVVAPYFIYLIYWCVLQREALGLLIDRYRDWCGGETLSKWSRVVRKAILPAYLICAALGMLFFVLFHLRFSNDLSKLDMTRWDKLLILILGCVPVLTWAALALRAVVRKNKIAVGWSACLLGGTTLLLSLGLLSLHVWVSPTFEERDMMISLSKDYDLDGAYVIGDYVMGITLYNDLKPVMDHYSNYASRMIENPDLRLFHYTSDSAGMRSYMDNTIFSPMSAYTAFQTGTIPGTLQVHGEIRDFALYQARQRNEVVNELNDVFIKDVPRIQRELDALDLNNAGLDTDELIAKREELVEELSKCYEPYPDYYGDRSGTILSPIYVDTYGDIRGDVCAPIYGRVYGDIYGDIKAPIYGGIYGDINGDLYVPVTGTVQGSVNGKDYSK